jgi:hypothetical protein
MVDGGRRKWYNTDISNTLEKTMSKYWNNQGRFNAEWEALGVKLMPAMGPAESIGGEMVRAVNKLYYDAFNNGFCNNTSGAANFLAQYAQPWLTPEFRRALAVVAPLTNTGGYSNVTDSVEQALDTLVDEVCCLLLNSPELCTLASPADMLDLSDAEVYYSEEDGEEDIWR